MPRAGHTYSRETVRSPGALHDKTRYGLLNNVAVTQKSYAPFDFIGTPEQMVGQIRPFVDLGVDTFLLDYGGFPDLTTLETLSAGMLPAFRERTAEQRTEGNAL